MMGIAAFVFIGSAFFLSFFLPSYLDTRSCFLWLDTYWQSNLQYSQLFEVLVYFT